MRTSLSRGLSAAVLALFALAHTAHAADVAMTPKAQLAADKKTAASRYTSDKALCNEESDSAARLQCRRDAKTAYDKALGDARTRMTAASKASATTAGKAAPACPSCGKVVSVTSQEKNGEGGALGMIAGGAVGALLGNQVGQGTGKDLATIAGAAGGAYAGKKIEERAKSSTVWTVAVEFQDGSKASYAFAQDPGFKAGDAVKKSGNTVVR